MGETLTDLSIRLSSALISLALILHLVFKAGGPPDDPPSPGAEAQLVFPFMKTKGA